MSYNQTNYNLQANNFTFPHMPLNFIPTMPPPPLYYAPPGPHPYPSIQETDEEYIKRLDIKSPVSTEKKKPNGISISTAREEIRKMVLIFNDIKAKEKYLSDNCNLLSEEEWKRGIEEVEQLKVNVNEFLATINLKLDMLRKLINKRSAKRLRLKRQRLEMQKEKEDRIKKLEENSRKIDENLQKIKDDIEKVKQDEESKLQADTVLKEVRRKKGDAKKCLVKLDALLKLRKARQNTVKGRGGNVSETEANVFVNNIEQLKTLWLQKLTEYNKEELHLQDMLKQDDEQKTLTNEKVEEVEENLLKWREHLFGGELPQADFCGDITRFIDVRSQWDQFVSEDGTPLPVGWVLPKMKV